MAIIQDIMNVVPSWQKHIQESGYLKAPGQKDYHQKAGYNFKENFPNTPAYLADALAKGYQYSTEGIGSFFNEGTFSDAMARAKEESRLNSLGFRGQGFDMYEYDQTMNFARTGDTSGLTYGSVQAATPDDMTRAMQTDHMRRRTNFPTAVPAHMRRQTSFPTAQRFANLDNFTRSPHTGFKKSGADLDKWGNRRMALENPAKDPYEKPSGLMQFKDWATDKLGTGVNWGKAALSGIGNAIMPGLGWALGAINPGKLRGYNYNQGRYNTQAEYEANRSARQYQKRLGNLLSRKASGKGYSQKNLNKITMGSRPGFYGNRATVSNINRAKHNIGMPEHLGDRGNISVSRSTNTNSPGHPSNANPGSGGGIGSAASKGKQQRGDHHFNRGGLASLWQR